VDVIHSWSVPGLGVKLDGIPGRKSMVGVMGLVCGTYSGY
jgi:heme/copper-type cytochrome/quinol oxidase subunit 2